MPLANFGSVTFSGASATIDGVAGPIDDSAFPSSTVYQIDMVSTWGLREDTTGPLNDAGTSFMVEFDH